MEQEFKNKTVKSLYLHDEIYHIWLSMASQDVLDINVSDNVTNTSYVAAEFNGLKYTIKNERIFNDVVIKAMTEVLISSPNEKIDDDYNEILIQKGACVEMRFVINKWYILSPYGLKNT